MRAPLGWGSLWSDTGGLSLAQELSHGEGKLEVTLQILLWSNVLGKSLTGQPWQPVLSEDVMGQCHPLGWEAGLTLAVGTGCSGPFAGCRTLCWDPRRSLPQLLCVQEHSTEAQQRAWGQMQVFC